MSAIEVITFTSNPREEETVPSYVFPKRTRYVTNADELEWYDEKDEEDLPKKERDRRRIFRQPMSFVYIHGQAISGYAHTKLYRDALFFIPLLVLVLIGAVREKDSNELFFMTQALTKTSGDEMGADELADGPLYGKTFADIENPDAWSLWLRTVSIPFWFDADSEEDQVIVNNYVQGYNLRIGALRFRVKRMLPKTCTPNDRWITNNDTVYPIDCWAGYGSNSSIQKTGFNGFSYYDCDSILSKTVGKRQAWDCSGFVHDIPLSYSRKMALEEVDQMEIEDYVNTAAARFFILNAFTYNPSLNTFSFLQQFIEIAEGGSFTPQSRVIHFKLFQPIYCVDLFLLLVWVLFLMGRWIMHWIHAMKKEKGLNFFLTVWNLIDMINYVFFWGFFACRFAWWSLSNKIDFRLPEVASEYAYNVDMEHLAQVYNLATFFFAFNIILTLLTVLKYASLNPRLNILTRSLDTASRNMIGLIILFFVVLLAYCLAGVAMFGPGVEDFRNPQLAFSTLMRMLLGDCDYESLRHENLHLAGLFYWTFLILGLFLLLNFIVALIGDAFTIENKKTKAKSLREQIADAWRSIKRVILHFFRDPAGTCGKLCDDSAFAQHARHTILIEVLEAYRENLPVVGITMDDFAKLPLDEREDYLPNPMLARADVSRLFMKDEESQEKLEYLTDQFLDEFWIDAWKEYKFHRSEDAEAMALRKMNIREFARKQLRTILSLPGGDRLDDARSLDDLFHPTNATLDCLKTMEERVGDIENTSNRLFTTLCYLDAALALAHAKKFGKTISEPSSKPAAGHAPTLTPQDVVRQKPKSGLQPL